MVKVRYAILNSNDIVNLCGPERLPVGWTEFKIKKRMQATEELIKKRNEKDNFYNKLEDAILKEGVKNPILVTAGLFSQTYLDLDPRATKYRDLLERVPPNKRNNLDNLLTCDRWGGNRLYIAQKHGLEIPCIVNDFTNSLPNTEVLTTIDEVLDKFQDKPAEFNIDERGLYMAGWRANELQAPLRTGPFEIKYGLIPSRMISNDIQPDQNRIELLEKENGFFSKLEKSILDQGFRNPIVITATKEKISNRYGGSRLMFAQKHNMDIPCIIADFDNIFPDAKKISVKEIHNYFTDRPKSLYLVPHGINISGCEHVHLKD